MVAAVNVYAEGSSVANHATRSSFAIKVFGGAYNINAIGLMVLTNPTIAAEASTGSSFATNSSMGYAIPDGDIQFAINSLWNDMAGV